MTEGIGKRSRVSVVLLRDPGHCLALGLGTGLAPWAPGTWGSVLGFALYTPLASLDQRIYWALTALLFAIGIPLCARTAQFLGIKDHPAIVWDEIVGILITLGLGAEDLRSAVIGFALFRLFDITKPGPIRWLDRAVGGGLGIMVDDALAGLFAGLALALINYLS
ncbi:MAG: phosphatidylglycerophosphatase A [Gammaproteobacteria bacterium]|nr:phosphatidylglycerophosphatase A [Gammaproteobacteria bacterium]